MPAPDDLPYHIFDHAASLFGGQRSGFSHRDMSNFFRHELKTDVVIPTGLNRLEAFKWWLRQFYFEDQKRVLYLLCRHEYSHSSSYEWPSEHERHRLLQMIGSSPITLADQANLEPFDTSFIRETWTKTLHRVADDPEGAITTARSLLESVCKHILDEGSVEYPPNADLPKLFGITAQELKLSPSNHTEEAFKRILGGVEAVVNGLANLRNRLGDAHGQGKRPVKPAPRHAELAVNMAGSLASFLLATVEQRRAGEASK